MSQIDLKILIYMIMMIILYRPSKIASAPQYICAFAYLLMCITCPSSLFCSFMLLRASRVQTANPSTFTLSMLRHSSVLPSEINTANRSQLLNPTLQNSDFLKEYYYSQRRTGTPNEQKVGEGVELKLNPLASSAIDGGE